MFRYVILAHDNGTQSPVLCSKLVFLLGFSLGMPDAFYSGMTKDKAIIIRANEEITEHGSMAAAIAAIDAQLLTANYPPAFYRFMKRVRTALETARLDSL